MAFYRTSYGELYLGSNATEQEKELFKSATVLVEAAAKKNKITGKYENISFGRSGRSKGKPLGTRVLNEIYDISNDGKHVVVCVRETKGTKYGTSTVSKEYFIIHKHGTGTRVESANKSIVAKSAKQAGNEIGVAIDILNGKKSLKAKRGRSEVGIFIARPKADHFLDVVNDGYITLGKKKKITSPDFSNNYICFDSAEKAIEYMLDVASYYRAELRKNDLALIVADVKVLLRQGLKTAVGSMYPRFVLRTISYVEVFRDEDY